MSTVGIWSGKNVLKHALSDSDTMDKPNTSDGFLGYFSTKVITHNLGYVPLVRVSYDPDSDGSIFPANGQGRVESTSNRSPLQTVAPFWFYVDDVTTTTFTLRTYKTSQLSGTFPFYYRVYKDPSS